MNEVESRRIIPISRITIGFVLILAVFQVIMLCGMFELKSSTVKKTAPWFHNTFLKLVGEHPSTRPVAATEAEVPQEKKDSSSAIATVAGFKPEELAVTIEDIENPIIEPTAPVEDAQTVIPVSQPEKPAPVDEDVPVG